MKKLLVLGLVAGTSVTALTGCNKTKAKAKVTLITDAGDIDDKSFNQQAWEAVQSFDGTYSKPVSTDKAVLEKAYDDAIDAGAEMLVLPGFLHGDTITSHAAKNDKTNYIFIDGWEIDGLNNVAALSYEVEQAAYIAGWYAAENIHDSEGTPTTGKLGAYGGMNIPTVNVFMYGFEEGIKAYNAANSTTFEFLKDGAGYYYSGSFDAGGGTAVSNTLLGMGVDFILPVAGPQTWDTIAAIKNHATNKSAKVIGVDTDMVQLVDAGDRSMIFTSILKKIKESTVDAISAWKEDDAKVWKEKYGGKTVSGGLDEDWVGINKDFLSVAGADYTDFATVEAAAKSINM